MKSKAKHTRKPTGWIIALGAGLGAVAGIFAGNIGVWLGIGVAIGVALGIALGRKETECPECEAVHRSHLRE
jgi:hypothetical protein